MKRLWALMVLSVAATFIVAACGGGRATSTPTATPGGGVSTPVVESTPTQEPTPSPEPVPTATPTPPQETPGGSSAPASRYSWEVSTIDDNGAKPSLAVDPQGTPHIAYMLEAMPGFVKHAVHDSNGDWNISTVSTGYFYGPLDIVVDEGGVPQISWHNHDKENGAYAALVNGKWVVHDINHPGHDGWDINLSIDSSGRPHIISIDPSQFGSQSGVEYATFDGEVWQVEEVGSGPVPYEFGTGIALDSQDRVHVVWFDNSTKDLKYAITDGDSWDISTVDSEGDVGRFPSLALDKQGNPAISYYERMSDSEGYIKFARWDGSKWNTQRIDKLEKVFLGHFGARKNSSLVLDKDNSPIVAYSDEQVIKLAVWDGSQWNVETELTAGDSALGQQVSLAVDSTGVLHLTFADMTRKGGPGVKGAVKYARGTPTAVATGTLTPSLKAGPAPGSLPIAAPAPNPTPTPTPTESTTPDGDGALDLEFKEALRRTNLSVGWNTDFSKHSVPFTEIISGGPPRDWIPPLDDPKFTTFEDADKWLNSQEPVIAFEINGDARAYPIQIMTWHEIVNDVVGSVPVAVTFCPLCNAAIVFDRRLEGVVYDFGTSGKLRKSDLIMWDRQTESWWQQFTGEAIVGELTGKVLTFLPASLISWSDFKAANPEGKVLSRDTGFFRSYGVNPYAGYDRADNPPFLFDGELDGRLLPKERVAAVTIGDVDVAFPFSIIIEQEKVVNYTVNNQDLVVFFVPGTLSAFRKTGRSSGEYGEVGATGVFDPNLDGQWLTFRFDGDSILDKETGSVWNIRGQAIKGPLTGSELTPIVHANHFWFSWAAFRPDTALHQKSI